MTRYETITVEPLTPTIGAQVTGIDLSQPLTDQQFAELNDAWIRHLVLFFRDQHLSIAQHKAFGRRFGPLHVHPAYGMKDHPEVLEIRADEHSTRVAGEVWHTDVSCDPRPPMGSMLYLHEVPANGGGDTLFANMYRAWETLSAPMQQLLEGLRAVHDGNAVYNRRHGQAGTNFPVSEHPVATTHPVSGRRALFVNRGFTTRIVGLSDAESQALLEMLYRHLEREDFKCRFKWRPRSIAFWDNRCTQHQAIWDYHPLRRYGHRVTIEGEVPV